MMPGTLSKAQWAQGVSVFFVLSGFILTYAHPMLPTMRDTAQFWVARFARIWPAHIAALLLWIAVAAYLGYLVIEPDTFAANIALVHAWIPLPRFFFSYNAVSWSISTEFGFYLLFPVLILGLGTTWWWKLPLTLLIALSLVALCYLVPMHPGMALGIYMVNPLARLFEFTLGMCAALLWMRYLRELSMPVAMGTLIEVVAVLLLLVNVHFATKLFGPLAVNFGQPAIGWLFLCLAPAVPTAILLVVLAGQHGLLSNFVFGAAPIVFLGEISYSIYLTHRIVIGLVKSFALGVFAVPAIVAVTLLLSAAIWLVIERPCRRLLVQGLAAARPIQVPATAAPS